MFLSVLQVAQQQMSRMLSDADSLRRLMGAPQASLQTLATVLSLSTGQQPSALQEAAPHEIWQHGTQNALRYIPSCHQLGLAGFRV